MIYAISDLHGCYDRYRQLLEEIRFSPDDTLYVLGDVIDRGPEGFRIMRDMAGRPNVLAQLGNHEAMAMDAMPGLLRCVADGSMKLTLDESNALELWFDNGGEASLLNFLGLSQSDQAAVWDYMHRMPLYREVSAGGRDFLLIHGGLGHFKPNRPLSDYSRDEIVWCRPTPDTVYFKDRYMVIGHTPVFFLYQDAGRDITVPEFFRTESYIDIDCGCVFRGGRLGCLCLDTMEEIYV